MPFLLNGQSVKKLVKSGNKAFEAQDYYTASELYQRAYQITPIEEATYKWALSDFKKRDYKSSLALFKEVSKQNLSKYPLSQFYIAMNLNALGQYQKANQAFQKYYKKHRRNRDYFTLKAKQAIRATEAAFDMQLEPENIEVKLEDVLSEDAYSELMYRSVDSITAYLLSKRPVNKTDTFYSTRLFQVQNEEITVLDSNVNPNYFSNSGFCFMDENTVLISACAKVNNAPSCLIYKSEKANGTWSALKALPVEVNLPESKNIHPYFFTLANTSYLLFSSDVNGGQGGFDLYYSEYKNGKFKKAKNLGRRVNSIDNEISASYNTLQSKLFFSSEWYTSNGGYDIFFAEGQFPDVDVPENLGQPINSSYDDLFYSWSYDHKTAYFSSNRLNGEAAESFTCCNDIFSYQLPEITKTLKSDTLVLAKKLEKMEQLIPLDLYFDNDRPNPRSRDTITQLTYEQTYQSYFGKVEVYENLFSEGLKKDAKKNAIGMIDDFFYDKVEEGFEQLKAFNVQMIKLLREGYEIELTVKGFASPLNSSSYNINLSKRRVSSIVNYYKNVSEGLYQPYIDGSAEHGKLTIIEEAFGEDTAAIRISDDNKDLRNSVYSPWAAEERRVQILAFKLAKTK